jgi:hypothetical protein
MSKKFLKCVHNENKKTDFYGDYNTVEKNCRKHPEKVNKKEENLEFILFVTV